MDMGRLTTRPVLRVVAPGQISEPAFASTTSKPYVAATVIKRPCVKVDTIIAQLQATAEAYLPRLAAQTSAEAIMQCATQVSQPEVLRSSVETFVKSVRQSTDELQANAEATIKAAIGDVQNILLNQSYNSAAPSDVENLVRQVIHSTVSMSRADMAHQLNVKLLEQGQQSCITAPVCMEETLEVCLLDNFRSAVSTLTQFYLKESFEKIIRGVVLPSLAESLVNALGQHLLQLFKVESLQPVIRDDVRLAVQQTSKAVASESWRISLANAIPVCVMPLQSRASAMPAEVPPVPQRQSQPVSLLRVPLAPAVRQPNAPCVTQPRPALTPKSSYCVVPPIRLTPPAGVLTPDPSPVQELLRSSVFQNDDNIEELDSFLSTVVAAPAKSANPVKVPEPNAQATVQDQPNQGYVSHTTIEDLSTELLSMVLAYVEPFQRHHSCPRVCQQWRSVCESLWKQQVLRYEPRNKQRFVNVLLVAPELAMVDCERLACRSARAPAPLGVLNALLNTHCHVRGLRFPTQDLRAEYAIAVLERHAPTLEALDLTVTRELCDLSDPSSPSQLFRIINSMSLLRKLRLAGECDVEYTFTPRPLGAPPRCLEVLDLRDYHSSSAHTTSSLISAHQDTLRRALLSLRARPEELINLSLCPWLRQLTVPVDIISLHAPASLCSVKSLTLTQQGQFPPPELSPAKRRKTFLVPKLEDLILEGVQRSGYIPKPIRSAFDQLTSLTLRRTGLGPVLVDLLREMPLLERLVVDQITGLTTESVLGLPKVAPRLQYVRLGLRCHDGICWRDALGFLRHHLPQADVTVDLTCKCP